MIGLISKRFEMKAVIPIILIFLAMLQFCSSMWYILESKYLKNFTKESSRTKISFVYQFIGGIAASTVSMLGGLLLKYINIRDGFIVVGLIGLLFMVLVLDYMRKRFGLKPEKYSKEDIDF